MDRCDVIIVGGGPGGAACALTAARAGLTVVLYEPQRAAIDKPCGEGLMPPGVDALRELRLHDVLASGIAFDQLRYVLPSCAPLAVRMPRAGLAIDRPSLSRALDAALMNEPRIERRYELARVNREAANTFVAKSKSGSLRARTLVAADGLHGKAADWLRAPAARSFTGGRHDAERGRARRLGVRARFEARAPMSGVEVHFGHGCEVYLTSVPGGRITAAVLANDPGAIGAKEILALALARHPRAAAWLGARTSDPEARVLGGVRPASVARDGAFLVGDAGGGVDPILGCGVTIALATGITAAHEALAIVCGDVSGAPERRYRRAYRAQTRRRRVLASLLLATAEQAVLARATASIARWSPRLLDYLVGIAAGESSAREPSLAIDAANAR